MADASPSWSDDDERELRALQDAQPASPREALAINQRVSAMRLRRFLNLPPNPPGVLTVRETLQVLNLLDAALDRAARDLAELAADQQAKVDPSFALDRAEASLREARRLRAMWKETRA